MQYFLFLISLILASEASAKELQEYYRSARGMGMGGTSAAYVDGTDALFLNPAGLAAVENTSIVLAQSDSMLSDDLVFYYREKYASMGSPGLGTVKLFMGHGIAAQEQIVSAWTMPGLSFGLLVDQQVALRMRNRVFPKAELTYMTTQGIQVGTGIPILRGRHGWSDLRAGAAVKVLFRRGGTKDLPLIDIFNLSLPKLQQTAGNFGMGIGMDLGLQYEKKISRVTSLMTGLSYTNVGDTTFASAKAEALRSNLSFGFAYKHKPRLAEYIIAFDFRNIDAPTDWRKKNHLGLELKWPIISLYGGVNQVYFTYGVTLDIWPGRVAVYSYAEELGTFVRQSYERRWVLQVSADL